MGEFRERMPTGQQVEKGKIYTFRDVVNLFTEQLYRNDPKRLAEAKQSLQGELSEEKNHPMAFELGVCRKLWDTFGNKINWSMFFSREEVKSVGEYKYYHQEVRDFDIYTRRLSELGVTEEEIREMMRSSSIEDVVAFVDDFGIKAKERIVGALEELHGRHFEVTDQAEVWKGEGVGDLPLDEYVDLLANRDVSSGRLLVHATRSNLIEKQLVDPKLWPSAILHMKALTDEKYSDVSEALDRTKSEPGDRNTARGISKAVHFSFDNAVEYPKASFGAVFAAEAIVNNHAVLEYDEDNDINIGGTSNDFIEDPSHGVDIAKLGIFLIPESYKHRVDKLFQEGERRPRIFYYSTAEKRGIGAGLEQLRAQIGDQEKRVKVASGPKLCRHMASHEITRVSQQHVEDSLAPQMKRASELSREGEQLYDDVTIGGPSTFPSRGIGRGAGNWFCQS